MSFSLGRQVQVYNDGQTFGNASAGGAISNGPFLITLTPPLIGSGCTFATNGAAVDLASDTGPFGATAELIVDLTGFSEARMLLNVSSAGPANSALAMRFGLTHGGSFADLVSGGLKVNLNATAWQDTGWLALVPGATGLQYLHPWVLNDNNTTIGIQPAYLMFR